MKKSNFNSVSFVTKLGGLFCVTILLASLFVWTSTPDSAPGVIQLGVSPAFAAEEAISGLNEAGMAVYINTGQAIDLVDLEGTFEIVEDQTADYIIGSISLPNYEDQQNERFHAHAYVNTSGWIMVYFMESEPAAKIIDWKGYVNSGSSSINTLLEIGLEKVASDVGVGADNPTFYDFSNPSATHMMIVADTTGIKQYDQFTIELPSGNSYQEISWGLYRNGGGTCCSYFNIGGQTVAGSSLSRGHIGYGVVDLAINQEHLVEINFPAGLVIVYREQ